MKKTKLIFDTELHKGLFLCCLNKTRCKKFKIVSDVELEFCEEKLDEKTLKFIKDSFDRFNYTKSK